MKLLFSTLAYLTVCQILTVAQSVPTPPASVPTGEHDVFAPVTNEPFFAGGPKALAEYLSNSDLYPHQALQTQLEGTVRVRFRVLPSGYLTAITVVRSRGPILDHAALRTVAGMPRWFPAHQAGMAVARTVELPITFRID